MKNVVLGVLAVVFLAACCFPVGAPQAAAFESPLFESPLFAGMDSPLPTSTSVFPVIVLPTVTPKPPALADPPASEPKEFRVLIFPVQGGD